MVSVQSALPTLFALMAPTAPGEHANLVPNECPCWEQAVVQQNASP